MNRYRDSWGVEYTAASEQSVVDYSGFIRSYMGFRQETVDLLKALLTADPQMPMAVCAKGYIAKLIGCLSHSQRAGKISLELNQLVESVNATDREKAHAAALSAWCDGQLERATDIWESIMLDYPLDGLALRLAHFMHFYSGDGRKVRDSMARILPRWPENHPEYGFLLGMYAFGLEESGDYVRAESFGRRAVDINPEDSWSVHAVAHVMEMMERHEEGIEWVTGLEKSWSKVNNFRFHLYWHQCLYHLERGEFDVVLGIYDNQVVSDIDSGFYLDICNASSLLWRLEMFGVDVGDRWQRLAVVSEEHLQDQDLIFVSLHYLIPLIAAGDKKSTDSMLENIENWASQDNTQGRVCNEVGLSLARGMMYSREGRFSDAVDCIGRIRYKMDQIGGSKAQRDLFQMILIDTAGKSERNLESRALLEERMALRTNSDWTRSRYQAATASL